MVPTGFQTFQVSRKIYIYRLLWFSVKASWETYSNMQNMKRYKQILVQVYYIYWRSTNVSRFQFSGKLANKLVAVQFGTYVGIKVL